MSARTVTAFARAQATRKIFDLDRTCELPQPVDRVVREVEAHGSLDGLGLRLPGKAGRERGDERVIELKSRSHGAVVMQSRRSAAGVARLDVPNCSVLADRQFESGSL